MDDIFGDIIYIVLTLVVVLFSALKKKKTDKRRVPVPHQDVDDSMDERFPTLKDLFSEREEEEELPPEVAETFQTESKADQIPSESQTGPSGKSDYVFTSSTSVDDLRNRRKTRGKKLEDTESWIPEGDGDEYGIEDFDLKKAVVYSEILKRPDF